MISIIQQGIFLAVWCQSEMEAALLKARLEESYANGETPSPSTTFEPIRRSDEELAALEKQRTQERLQDLSDRERSSLLRTPGKGNFSTLPSSELSRSTKKSPRQTTPPERIR
jgi:hypothetical protein